MVQRCPAVPTAPKTMEGAASFRSAVPVRIMALLPPSSKMIRPSRSATIRAARRPTLVEPVREIKGRRASSNNRRPITLPGPTTRLKIPSGRLFSSNTRPMRFCTATAVSGVWEAGFQMTGSPQTAATRAFPRPGRHREIESGDNAHRPQRVVLVVQAVLRAFRKPW